MRVSREPVLATGAASIASGFKNVVCITLYNESFELLRNSLSALLVSIGGQGFSPTQAAKRSCIVIIADGRDRIDPEIIKFFEELRVLGSGRSFSALGETVHLSRKRIDEVMAGLGTASDLTGEVDFAVCVKDGNRGKLHSHALFFQGICPELRPELCYQLDAGTVVEAGAVSKLVGLHGRKARRRRSREPHSHSDPARRRQHPLDLAVHGFRHAEGRDLADRSRVRVSERHSRPVLRLPMERGERAIFQRRRHAAIGRLSARPQRDRAARAGHVSG
jgi:hypothetical protein